MKRCAQPLGGAAVSSFGVYFLCLLFCLVPKCPAR